MPAQIHVGDTGTSFELTIKNEQGQIVNLATVTIDDIEIIFMKPDGTTLTKTASFVTDGTDGKVKYVTVATDLDAFGTWAIQAYVNYVAGGALHSDIRRFEVIANLKP